MESGSSVENVSITVPSREDVERDEVSVGTGRPVRVDMVVEADERVVELAVLLLRNDDDVPVPVEHAPGTVDVSRQEIVVVVLSSLSQVWLTNYIRDGYSHRMQGYCRSKVLLAVGQCSEWMICVRRCAPQSAITVVSGASALSGFENRRCDERIARENEWSEFHLGLQAID